jgi:hypothetical protein
LFFFILKKTGALPSDWRFTIRNLSMERRAITINKDQYKFGKELGSGAFGSVYSVRHVPDSLVKKNIFHFH